MEAHLGGARKMKVLGYEKWYLELALLLELWHLNFALQGSQC